MKNLILGIVLVGFCLNVACAQTQGVFVHAEHLLTQEDEAARLRNWRIRSEKVARACAKKSKVVLQVLGSGGPIADDGRASASYLIWVDGKARVLVDVGGGFLPRFGAAGADIADLEVIALSHLHVDHVGGLPGFLKSGYFSWRKRDLPMIGPSGNERYPATDVFLEALLAPEKGAFRYLSAYQTGEGLFKISPVVVDVKGEKSVQVFVSELLEIEAISVKHGQIPALGFLIKTGGKRIAFAGDQSAESFSRFAELIADADVLVAHHAVAEIRFSPIAHLHARPFEIGKLAQKAQVKKLVLAHHMQRALRHLDKSRAAILQSFSGPVVVADDLSCIPLL